MADNEMRGPINPDWPALKQELDAMHRKMGGYSKGMKQRAKIAAALVGVVVVIALHLLVYLVTIRW